MWWMPWRLQAKKDVAACEKPRGAGKRALIRGYPNGETRPLLQSRCDWRGEHRFVIVDVQTRCARCLSDHSVIEVGGTPG
jgi:hypothetical protein